jgi:hypothetical protein
VYLDYSLLPRGWRQRLLLKHWYPSTELRFVMSWKIGELYTTVGTSNVTCVFAFLNGEVPYSSLHEW